MSTSFSPLHEVRSHDELLPDAESETRGMNGSDAHENGSSKNAGGAQEFVTVEERTSHATDVPLEERNSPREAPDQEYRVYKRRFFGLTQLILLNIIVSWDVGQRRAKWESDRLLTPCCSGSRSRRFRQPLRSTFACLKMQSTGSVLDSSLHLSLSARKCHPLPLAASH